MLLQAVVTLDRLQQDGNQLGPLPGAIQSGHLGDQHSDLRRYLLERKEAETVASVAATRVCDQKKKKSTNER